TFDELIKEYAKSRFYWHAAGFGEDERSEPIRFEHFGISTVESMAAGCVPIVFGKAGQREIVRHGRDGLLWKTLDELSKQTRWLIGNSPREASIREAARGRSLRFGQAAFDDRLDRLLAG